MLSSLDACLGRLPRPLQGRLLARLLLARPQVHRAGQPAQCMASLQHAGAAGPAPGLPTRTTRAHASAAVAEAQPPATEDFFAAGAVTFSSLGLREEVCAALQAAGYPRPAHAQVRRRRRTFAAACPSVPSCGAHTAGCRLVSSAEATSNRRLAWPRPRQELALPPLLAGHDVVLAAETGSGKTLAYLAPLVDWALRSRAAAAAHAAADEAPGTGAAPERRRRHATAALVLCPNAALCEQVAAAAGALRDPASGAPLAATALVSSQSPPPPRLPDVVVTTPGALVSLLDGVGTSFGYEWTRAGAPCLPCWWRLRRRWCRLAACCLAACGSACGLLLAVAATSLVRAVGAHRPCGAPHDAAGLPGWARCVVFDEADLLLSGGYGAQMRIIWDALRGGDRLHAARRLCAQVRRGVGRGGRAGRAALLGAAGRGDDVEAGPVRVSRLRRRCTGPRLPA